MAGEGVEGEAVAGATAVEETEEVLAVATAGEERVVAQVAAKARVAVPVALKEEAVAPDLRSNHTSSYVDQIFLCWLT